MKTKKNKTKWSNKHKEIKISFWNPWSYSNERHDYCKSLNQDILGLAELHNEHIKPQFAEKRWITSDAAEKDENGRYKDPAAGVVILLSKRMADKVMSWGNVGARIVWVRLAGPICNLFVVVTYIPHKGRVSPSADDTIGELHTLLKSVAKSDCIVLLGDFNCQLPRNVEGCTGKWSMTTRSDNAHGDKILDLMRAYDLFATDTLFKPVKKRWGNGKRKRLCNTTYLPKDPRTRPRKLDYMCVSNRWKSMVRNSSVKWAPAMHRFDQKFDHAMLSATWRWRTKKTDKFEAPDYQAMDSQSWDRFDSHLRIKTQESTDAKTDTMHMQSDINAAGIDSAHAKTDIMHMQSDIAIAIANITP